MSHRRAWHLLSSEHANSVLHTKERQASSFWPSGLRMRVPATERKLGVMSLDAAGCLLHPNPGRQFSAVDPRGKRRSKPVPSYVRQHSACVYSLTTDSTCFLNA